MLVDAGAKWAYGGEGWSHPPLHVACLFLQAGSVQTLLRRNADENEYNDSDDLPHDIVGHGIPEEERDNNVVVDIHKVRR